MEVKEGPFLLERYNSDDPAAFVEIATEHPSKIQAVTHLKDDPLSSSMEKVSAKADAKHHSPPRKHEVQEQQAQHWDGYEEGGQ